MALWAVSPVFNQKTIRGRYLDRATNPIRSGKALVKRSACHAHADAAFTPIPGKECVGTDTQAVNFSGGTGRFEGAA